jgi:hypothetical protein
VSGLRKEGFLVKTSTEELVKKVSKLKAPNKDLQVAAMMLGDAAARVDHKLIKRSTKLAHRLLLTLKKALPETDPQLIETSLLRSAASGTTEKNSTKFSRSFVTCSFRNIKNT